jgi:NitT/TauT family transport system substrate-binding protein
MTKINRRDVARGLIAVGAAASVGGAWTRPARAQSLRKVSFLLDVNAYGKHALFYPAIENGYFRDAGLDVTFQPGKGSADVSVKIAAGSADAGFADAATTILARSKGAKLNQVMLVHYKNMNNATTLASNPVRKPQDLVGKKMGATAGDAPRVALPALAKLNHFDHTKVDIITMESPAKPAMLMSKQVDGVFSLAAYAPVMAAAAHKQGQEIVQMLFADFGLDIYSNGIVVNDEVAAKDPAFVKALVGAFARSCVFAVEKPAEATAMFMKHNPAANPEIARAQLDVAITHLMVDEVKQHGIGPMSEKKMAFTVDIVHDFYGMHGKVETADVYTNDFAPSGLKPKV